MCQSNNTTFEETLESFVTDLVLFRKNILDNYKCLARDAEFVKHVGIWSEVFSLEREVLGALRDIRRYMSHIISDEFDRTDGEMKAIAQETHESATKAAQLLRDQANQK